MGETAGKTTADAPTLAQVIEILDGFYPPRLKEGWDAVGLVAGDPAAPIRRVFFAVDPVRAAVEEAIARHADLMVVHHPLLLRAVHSVAATTFKGAIVHRLIASGTALYTAHTNADAAQGGVADALGRALGLTELTPLVPAQSDPGAGIGRVGTLPSPMTLGDFAKRLHGALPPTSHGVRIAGDLEGTVQRVAVLGGAGDSEFDAVRAAGVDAYVTADLRHHPASEARERAEFDGGGKPYLLDVAHSASEWHWLADAARRLADAVAAAGRRVATYVCPTVADPWTAHLV
ncbi:MAG: Nif3-like dinuclear metal center hexameric protein [Bifidobacteriaceae bacterium]|jgi:dinuclear metal center YbgI/SA1388 family protein|nr:Nif3-like dinuclear metal center hexameric protein [Bifidobacteriaceae bacterium]